MLETLPLSILHPLPSNPRRTLDPEYIVELAQSMKEHGQWEPILVRPKVGGGYEIIAGHCRVEATKANGWSHIKAEVRDLTDEEADFLALDTNLKRRNLDEIEEAQGIHRMMDSHGWSQAKTAERFGKSQRWIAYRLSLVERLVPEVQEQVSTRVLNPSTASRIAQAPAEMQPAIAQKVQEADLSTRETERLVKVVTSAKTPADVKQAVLSSPKVTPEHAEAIAKVKSPTERAGILKDVEAGRLTAEETAKEAAAVIKRTEAPPSIIGAKVGHRTAIFPRLTKARDLLGEITGQDVYALEREDLSDLRRVLEDLGSNLNLIGRWTTTALDKQANQEPKDSKILQFRASR